MNERQLFWLAGLLEGEGCFSAKRRKNRATPEYSIQVNMNDEDIIARVAEFIGCAYSGPHGENRGKNNRPYYQIYYSGQKALDLMLLLQPLMGQRRSAKIAEIASLCV